MTDDEKERILESLARFRAEHYDADLLERFTEPAYFPELMTPQPCFLVGGRGTGKTTTLRAMSYQLRLRQRPETPVRSLRYVGIYHKITTLKAANFSGPEVDQKQWDLLFCHFYSVVLSQKAFEFIAEHLAEVQSDAIFLAIRSFVRRTFIGRVRPLAKTASGLVEALREELDEMGSAISEIGSRSNSFRPSAFGEVLEALTAVLSEYSRLTGLMFFFLLDEYESLSDSQQRIINSFVKNAAPPVSFKVGVRERGFRVRETLSPGETLVDPADYRRIAIVDRLAPGFRDFAAGVIHTRFRQVLPPERIPKFSDYFEVLTIEDEAKKLGLGKEVQRVSRAVNGSLDEQSSRIWSSLKALERYTVWFWSGFSVGELIKRLRKLEEPSVLRNVMNNYAVASLYTLASKKEGSKKEYCGWNTLCALSGGNIRYLIELVEQALRIDWVERQSRAEHVSVSSQTEACERVGAKNLRELEGLSNAGGKLTKVVLALGRVFEQLAKNGAGHIPEATQFSIKVTSGEATDHVALEALLNDAIMNLAFVRFPGTKLQEPTDIRSDDFMLHPIYSALFKFSFRRKRKIEVSDRELLGISSDPETSVGRILVRNNRNSDAGDGQLALFGVLE